MPFFIGIWFNLGALGKRRKLSFLATNFLNSLYHVHVHFLLEFDCELTLKPTKGGKERDKKIKK
jgi:hypothetical protein